MYGTLSIMERWSSIQVVTKTGSIVTNHDDYTHVIC